MASTRGRLAALVAAVLLLVPLDIEEAAAQDQNPCDVRDDSVLADMSTNVVTIDSGFSGAPLLIFGAMECPGEVVIILRGPRRQLIVREKMQVAGIWVNGSGIEFSDVPSLYAVASTAPVHTLLPEGVRRARGVGLRDLHFLVERTDQPDLPRFRQALIEHHQRRNRYTEDPVPIEVVRNKLFRASLWLPPTVLTGQYIVDVYLVHNNMIVGTHTMPLAVYRSGLQARIYDFAHQQPALYGLLAIIASVSAGWAIGAMFRR